MDTFGYFSYKLTRDQAVNIPLQLLERLIPNDTVQVLTSIVLFITTTTYESPLSAEERHQLLICLLQHLPTPHRLHVEFKIEYTHDEFMVHLNFVMALNGIKPFDKLYSMCPKYVDLICHLLVHTCLAKEQRYECTLPQREIPDSEGEFQSAASRLKELEMMKPDPPSLLNLSVLAIRQHMPCKTMGCFMKLGLPLILLPVVTYQNLANELIALWNMYLDARLGYE